MLTRTGQLVIVAGAGLAMAACSLPLVAGADFDPGLRLTGYSTFAWDEADALPTGDPRLDNNPFFVERLHAAIAAELERRGLRYDAVSPGLLVHHHATVRDRVEVFEADRRRGYDPSSYGEGTSVLQWEEGTFLVDVADRETKRVVWRGWATTDIERALADPVKMTDLVNEAVARMFRFFPASLGAGPRPGGLTPAPPN